MILVRKTVFAAVAMALGDAGADLQIYIGILVLCVSIALQQLHKPFTEDLLDRMELYALLTSFLTLYFSLFVLSKKWITFASAMIVGLNVAYAIYVARNLYLTSGDQLAAGAAALKKVRRGSFVQRLVRKLTGSSDAPAEDDAASEPDNNKNKTATVGGDGGGRDGAGTDLEAVMQTNPMVRDDAAAKEAPLSQSVSLA